MNVANRDRKLTPLSRLVMGGWNVSTAIDGDLRLDPVNHL
jgi:hypothetical protein